MAGWSYATGRSGASLSSPSWLTLLPQLSAKHCLLPPAKCPPPAALRARLGGSGVGRR